MHKRQFASIAALALAAQAFAQVPPTTAPKVVQAPATVQGTQPQPGNVPPASGAMSATAAPVAPKLGGDTIGERANLAIQVERMKGQPVAAVAPTSSSPLLAMPTMRVGPFAMIGVRGFQGDLSGTFLINGERCVGSQRYPQLCDGWALAEMTESGAVIVRGKERRQVAFTPPQVYQSAPQVGGVPAGGTVMPSPLPAGMPR